MFSLHEKSEKMLNVVKLSVSLGFKRMRGAADGGLRALK